MTPFRTSSLVELDNITADEIAYLEELARSEGQTLQQFMRAASADFVAHLNVAPSPPPAAMALVPEVSFLRIYCATDDLTPASTAA